MVNGQAATIWFISPGQINMQAPGLEATGPVNITVTDSRLLCPQTSQPSILTQQQTAPGMLAKPGWLVGGKQYLTAWFADLVTFVGNIPGFSTSRPVKSGERIVAYGVGFGPTNPFVAAGTITTDLNRIAGDLQISIGGVPLQDANIEYAGLAPGYIGLYQFNLLIPPLPDGDHQVIVILNGVPLPQTFYITVLN